MTKTYLVTWEIEVEADSPEEAAVEAREIQLDDCSTATVFRMNSLGDVPTVYDVGDLALCKFCNKATPKNTPHQHQGRVVCADCWDERLRSTS